ncbi:unnamed protein product [Darwinula stevensoni]|uniref:MOB-like protein phocein n=1 Tax=Darwinula stevensoni TaxID=69355 RepID=A0A7R9AEF5_9CRUS|nr:unnamed protein product [Darwinula stevensoni]CAG0902335.1 unnamed protein product [Darwinula stevensoni]
MVVNQSMTESATIVRRNSSGTKTKEWCAWPPASFEEMDSTLTVQQLIQQTIRSDPSNIDHILTPPENQDEGVWKYEHLRQFCLELNGLAVQLQSECFPEQCSQMTATEQWIFLCAAHKTPKECPAIDYTRHTLDGAACLLNSNKYFPSSWDCSLDNLSDNLFPPPVPPMNTGRSNSVSENLRPEIPVIPGHWDARVA